MKINTHTNAHTNSKAPVPGPKSRGLSYVGRGMPRGVEIDLSRYMENVIFLLVNSFIFN